MISAKIVADSRNEFGNRITTMEVIMPRFILAEFNTHRMFSRNSASSRAIPFEKMLKMVEETPFIPMAWQVDHKGMQGTEYANYPDTEDFKTIWLEARDNAIASAKLAQTGNVKLTKQLCNRLLEPFMYHKVLVTATEWENFFALRCPQYVPMEGENSFRSQKDVRKFLGVENEPADLDYWLKINKGQAEIHMMALAEAMWDAYNESVPKELKAGEWHICYEDKIEKLFHIDQSVLDKDGIPVMVKIGSVMGARVSYTTIGTDLQEWTMEKYCNKSDELSTAKPLHASPFEHCGKAMTEPQYNEDDKGNETKLAGWSGNFKGFIQYRKTFTNENITRG